MNFRNIAMNKDGQKYGAVRFNYSININVNNSHFENVASAIRFINSNGPLLATFSTALNPGRNFFQCDTCTGGNIRINHNSMEHTQQVASQPLEDFINIFKSSGTSNNWIQVNYNRARTNATGSGVSANSCFILLGDYDGAFQEAKNNIGVNPAQCGIGAAGGTLVKIENNKMYSQLIQAISNVAFYSDPIPGHIPCHFHLYSNNQANWIFGKDPQSDIYGMQNKSWTDPDNEPDIITCDITLEEIRDDSSVLINLNMGLEIWNMW